MNREELIYELQHKPEMNPDVHDGSYEVVREIVASYSKMTDYSNINYLDMNAVYLMAIGTWKINVEKKKEKIDESHLPTEEKTRIKSLLDTVWDNTCREKYQNIHADSKHTEKYTFGMFGTGFYSFEGMTTDECARNFIKMLVDISRIEPSNENEIFDRAEAVLSNGFKGMKAASASMVLHCLFPTVFPIMNSNGGFGTIFSMLGISLTRPSDIDTYISNCRNIKAFRDINCSFKNYRIMDMFAWQIDDGYFPSMLEYDPEITTEQYIEMLQDEEHIKLPWLDTIYYMYLMGGEASCKQIEAKYGNTYSHYNLNATNTAQTIYEITKCPLFKEGDKVSYWPIMFQGRYTTKDELGDFAWRLRPEISDAISQLDEKGFFKGLIKMTDKTLDFNLNTILYGPPGTGKTYNTVVYAVAIVENKSLKDVMAEDYAAVKERFDSYKDESRIAFTTFHQSYGYEEFIEGIKPEMDSESSQLNYKIEPGIFKEFCDRAAMTENEVNYVFVIDEINRGNISKIFGELITLIETTKRLGMEEETTAKLPYSGSEFGVPKNVYILGTMNTADRSIALMDTALRRRFSFVEMMPNANIIKELGADKVTVLGKTLDVASMLETINNRIEFLFDREHTIGHAFFTGLKDDSSLSKLESIFKTNIIPLLQEYFYEDYEKIQLVLGDNKKSSDDYKFIIKEEKYANSVFNGSPELDSMSVYTVNEEAFKHIESYIEISGVI